MRHTPMRHIPIRHIGLRAALAGAAMSCGPASASIVALVAAGDDGAGSTFRFEAEYDAATPAVAPVDPGATYAPYHAVVSARIWIDGELVFDVPDPSGFLIPGLAGVWDDATFVPTGMLWDGFGILVSADGQSVFNADLLLRDFDFADASGLELPTAFDLTRYEDRLFSVFDTRINASREFQVTSLTPVIPAPGGPAAALAAALLAARRRR